jgi:cytochrome c-type biogenesis protein CcmH/NrfG
MAVGALLVALAAMPVHAQQSAPDSSARVAGSAPAAVDTVPVPARPSLRLGADTNSAQGYFEYGMAIVGRNPEEATRAFYWAYRIDPSSGDALYALHAATVLAMSEKELQSYLNLGKKKRLPKYVVLDSMEYRAYAMNPFVFATFDPELLRRALETQMWYEHPHATSMEVGMNISAIMRGEANFAWLQYSQNHLPEALATYAKVLTDTTKPRWARARDSLAIRKHRQALAIEMHAQRAKIFYLLDDMDSAATEMNTALEGMREHDEKEQTFFYRSKAMYLQALGMIYQRANKVDSARAAYGRALEEDLSFYAAHTHLAQLDLARHDTAGALAEMDLAVQLNPSDPVVRYSYAEILVHAKRDGDAAAQLKKAIALDPYYGAPHLLLALIADVEQYTEDAVSEYTTYVAVASKKDEKLLVAKARLKELTATIASNPPKQ